MNKVLIHNGKSYEQQQRTLLYALLPVVLCSALMLGVSLLFNVLLCCAAGIASEALGRVLRGLPGRNFHRDLDTVYIALILGLCLPPSTPWWLLLLGMSLAILLFKHAFGGFGEAPFHPAMAALLVLWVSFPDASQNWSATMPFMSLSASDNVAPFFATEWVLINGVALVGGLYLIAKGHIPWHIPLAIVLTLVVLSCLFVNSETANLFHVIGNQLFNGGTMLTAFFIASYPPACANTKSGQWLFAVVLAMTLFAVRLQGGFVEGIACAVVLANFASPLLDQFTRTTRYGNAAAQTGRPTHE